MLINKAFTSGNDRSYPIEAPVHQAAQLGFQCLPINLSPDEIRTMVRDIMG